MANHSVKHRFVYSLISNGMVGLLTGLTSLILARSMGPSDYGVFVFLAGSFLALRVLTDLGSGVAFYTFISQKPRGIKFLKAYLGWQGIQFLFPIIIIGLAIPEAWVHKIWLGQDRGIILLAFLAVFMRYNAWQTLIYLGESQRLTVRVQLWTAAISVVHLSILIFLWRQSLVLLPLVLLVTTMEYIGALCLAWKKIGIHIPPEENFNGKALLRKYRDYCTPLIGLSVLSFGSAFSDRWLLQHFGGPVEQAFYGIGQQFSVVGLLAATALVNIFWKEISEAHTQKNNALVKHLYQKTIRFLFFIGACFSGCLIPWSEEIVILLFGSAYAEGSTALAIMLLYPIHRSFYQLTLIYLLAVGHTKIHLKYSAIFFGIGIPISYLVQADKESFALGQDMGAVGMALKIFFLQILEANLLHWWITKNNKWEFDWFFQLFSMGAALCIGYISYEMTMAINFHFMENLVVKFMLSLFIYFALMSVSIWLAPGMAGTSRQEVRSHASEIYNQLLKGLKP